MVFTDPTTQPAPDFSDLDLSEYLIPEPILPYAVSRGCYWGKCVFCQNRVGGFDPRPYQVVPADKALADLSVLATTHHCRHFHFCSDVIDPEYLKAFSEAVLASKTIFSWDTNLRVEEAFTQDFCQMLGKAGLNSVTLGVESGCQKTLDAMDKGTDVATAGHALKNLYNAGIATQATGFFGFPGESEMDARMTVRFLREQMGAISAFDISPLLILPGARIHENPSEFGVARISYRQNPMMTPEPIWNAAGRIPQGALNMLYELLGRIEQAGYVVNADPYVGAFCSNHSLLYFRLGPDILKRLHGMANQEHQELHQTFGIDRSHRATGELIARIPRPVLPYVIYRSPYHHERSHFGSPVSPRQPPLAAGEGWDYLLDPINVPLQVSHDEVRLLENIDGLRDLSTILDEVCEKDGDDLKFFLIRLVSNGLVKLAD